MLKKIYLILIIISFPLSTYSFDREEANIINLYEKINPAIVAIDAKVISGVSCGTGCIISKTGAILTSSHVVDGSYNIEVTTFDGQKYQALLVKNKSNYQNIGNEDLAIIKINPKIPLKTVNIGDSSRLKVGQKVLTIGNPFGFNGTLTQGIISRIDYKKNKVQTDAAINPGCSGGPLLNMSGEVIGINQAIYNPDDNISNIGIGFAIPINEAKRLLSIR